MPDHFYVYPSYLRKRTARALGRRVPQELALTEVTVEQIVGAAVQLGYRAEAETAKSYPREAHLGEGRVRISKRAGSSKQATLRAIAERLRSTATPPSGRSGG